MLPLLIPLIAGLAPYAAKAIGSALGGGAGKEVAASLEPAITQAALQATGQTSVEAAAAVLAREPANEQDKAARAAFITRVNELATQVRLAEMQATTQDKAGARSLLRDLAQMGSINAYFMPALTTLYTVGFFFFAWWLLTTPTGFDERRSTIVNVVSGALIIILKDLIAFWTGTTAGSKMKDARDFAIPPSTRQPEPPQAPFPPTAAPSSPPVVVVQPTPPAAPVAPSPEQPGPSRPAPVPITPPGTPGASGGWRRIRPGAAAWMVTEDGVLFEGDTKPGRTIGEPVTVARIWRDFGKDIVVSCTRNRVPYLLAVACIATESGGKVKAILTEPDGRQSVGLMQTLHATASEMMGHKVTTEELNDPAFSIEAGVRYIADRRKVSGYDPVLVAAAHNAGGVYPVEDDQRSRYPNEFRIRSTGDHIRRFCAYFNDAVFVEKRDGWAAQAADWAKQA